MNNAICIQVSVAIPFSFRVTCNSHFFRLDRLKTYLIEPRFFQIPHGSFSTVQYLKKFRSYINLIHRSKPKFCSDEFFLNGSLTASSIIKNCRAPQTEPNLLFFQITLNCLFTFGSSSCTSRARSMQALQTSITSILILGFLNSRLIRTFIW